MKIKLTILILLLSGIVFGQVATRNPSNVRYIGGNYQNKSPFFNNLKSALDNVRATATEDNPYVFWLASDTTFIYDWDSTYAGASLSMKDSINAYYVAYNKIKWGGFGFTLPGTHYLTPQDSSTTYYSIPIWDPTNSYYAWQDSLNNAMTIIDNTLYSLIVYTDTNHAYIENDTLKINLSWLMTYLQSQQFIKQDSTTFVRTTGNQTIDGNKTFDQITMGTASKFSVSPLDTAVHITGGVTRGLFSDNQKLLFDENGDGTFQRLVDSIWVVDYFNVVTGIDSFDTTAESDTITATGIGAADVVLITARDSVLTANDMLSVRIITDAFVVLRPAGGTSGLKYNYIWKRD